MINIYSNYVERLHQLRKKYSRMTEVLQLIPDRTDSLVHPGVSEIA